MKRLAAFLRMTCGDGRRRRPVGKRRPGLAIPALVLLSAGLSAGCELTEVTVAEPEPVIVAEVYLEAGDGRQHAYLHRTFAGDSVGGGPVPGATIEVRDGNGGVLRFAEADSTACFLEWPGGELSRYGTCYQAPAPPESDGTGAAPLTIAPGGEYTLRIELADGGVLEGATRVPGDFELLRPDAPSCRLAPDTRLDFIWTRSDGASLYVAETRLSGLDDALARQGIEIDPGWVFLLGLAASRSDTTIVFPTEFGIFDRFELPSDALLAIRDGLPEHVRGPVTIAAVDRNFTNWVRGGNFHPSGRTRIPSIRGDGTGVFASLVPRTVHVSVAAEPDPARPRPACTPEDSVPAAGR